MTQTYRMGMVGGGHDSMMGRVHRLAARLTGRIELVCGAFGATRQKSYETGTALGLHADRVHGTYREMMKKESRRAEAERVDFVSIVTPNNMHYPVSMAALDADFHVLCEQAMTTSLDEALNLRRKLLDREREFGLMHTVAGYPMVQEARQRIRAGEIGTVRKIVLDGPRGWLSTRLETAGHKQAGWRMDARRVGRSGSLGGDDGVAGLFLLEYMTDLAVTEVSADLHTFIPGRPTDDDGTVLLRFDNGARGVAWASQVACGESANGLKIRLYGDKGGLVWRVARPNQLEWLRPDGSRLLLGRESEALSDRMRAYCWLPPAIEEGYLEACANLYLGFIARLDAFHSESPPDVALPDCPGVDRGVRVALILDAIARNVQDELLPKWTAVDDSV